MQPIESIYVVFEQLSAAQSESLTAHHFGTQMIDANAPGTQLDTTQYQAEAIAKYEAVYGQHFISPGGAVSARACIARLGLKPGMRVLDVGCGLGGSAFLMAREYGVSVHGIDVSANMLASARERLRSEGLTSLVTLECHNSVACCFPVACFSSPITGVVKLGPTRSFPPTSLNVSTTCVPCKATARCWSKRVSIRSWRRTTRLSSFRLCVRRWPVSPTTRRTPTSAGPGWTRSNVLAAASSAGSGVRGERPEARRRTEQEHSTGEISGTGTAERRGRLPAAI